MRKFFATIAALAVSYAANAQSEINNESMTREKSTVTVSFKVETKNNGIAPKMKEVIKPYIYNGADTLWLDEVAVYGKGRFLRERQVNHINGNKSWTLGKNQVMKGAEHTFSQQVEVESWMTNATLGVCRVVEGCGKCGVFSSAENLTKAELFVIPEFVLEDLSKHVVAEQENLEIIFRVSKVEIDHRIFNNEVNFSKILAAVDRIYGERGNTIEKIQISGFASPEGGSKFNTWLGENRAKALIDYIIKQRPEYGLTYSNFEVVNGEENWRGLRKVLEQSKMKQKAKVIAIIDDATLKGEAKKRKIKELDGGRVWRAMVKEIYSELRSAKYKSIFYYAENDNNVEVINRANAMIREGRHQEAYELALTISNDKRAYNTIGVALMAQGKLKEAIKWFEKAVKENDRAAQRNIDAIVAEYGAHIK